MYHPKTHEGSIIVIRHLCSTFYQIRNVIKVIMLSVFLWHIMLSTSFIDTDKEVACSHLYFHLVLVH